MHKDHTMKSIKSCPALVKLHGTIPSQKLRAPQPLPDAYPRPLGGSAVISTWKADFFWTYYGYSWLVSLMIWCIIWSLRDSWKGVPAFVDLQNKIMKQFIKYCPRGTYSFKKMWFTNEFNSGEHRGDLKTPSIGHLKFTTQKNHGSVVIRYTWVLPSVLKHSNDSPCFSEHV